MKNSKGGANKEKKMREKRSQIQLFWKWKVCSSTDEMSDSTFRAISGLPFTVVCMFALQAAHSVVEVSKLSRKAAQASRRFLWLWIRWAEFICGWLPFSLACLRNHAVGGCAVSSVIDFSAYCWSILNSKLSASDRRFQFWQSAVCGATARRGSGVSGPIQPRRKTGDVCYETL